jgi:hypothetical protein
MQGQRYSGEERFRHGGRLVSDWFIMAFTHTKLHVTQSC